MQDKEFDKVFRDKFDAFELDPPAMVWDEVSSSLDNASMKSGLGYWWAAASIAGVLLVGLWFMRPVTEIRLHAAVPKPVEPVRAEDPQVSAKQQLAETLASLTINDQHEKRKLVRLKERFRESRAALSRTVDQIDLTKGVDASLLAARKTTTTPLVEELQIAVNNQPVSGELSYAMVTVADDEPVRSKQGLRSITDIFNFVLSKVDKRKDKLLEFSETDEGALVSGINLGVIKYKSKQTAK